MNSDIKKSQQPILDISQVVHDIKNPLTTIIASIELLKSNKLQEKDRKQLYDMIGSESKNILDFINDILEISKIENEAQTKSEAPCNLAIITGKILRELKPFSLEKNIKIKVDVPENLSTDIPEIRLKQILSNLISNSIKYNKTNGKIIINAYQKEKRLYMEIEDTGIGISSEEKEKVFNKFYRCDEAKKLNIKGTGLGLSIVDNIVKAYGGKIEIISNINRGSKFIISLPA